MSFASDIATAIAARVTTPPVGAGEIEGPVDLIYGQNCREGPERKKTKNQAITGAVPDECVFVVPSGAITDEPFRGGDPTLTPRTTAPEDWPGIERPTADVVVRSPIDNWDRGYQLANVCKQAIDKLIVAGYFEVRASIEPSYVREDEENHHIFTFPVEGRRCK